MTRSATSVVTGDRAKLDVLILHPSRTDGGGIVNATLFHGLALKTMGLAVEIWTGSHVVGQRCQKLQISAHVFPALSSVAESIASPTLIAAALQLRRRGVRSVLSEGAKQRFLSQILFPNALHAVVFHNRKISGRRSYPVWITISNRHKADLQAYAAGNALQRTIVHVPNGPLPDFGTQGARRSQKHSVERCVFGSASNFVAKKNVPLLLKAFAIVAEQNPNVHLALAGDGPERPACLALASQLGVSKRITWLGWLTDMQPFYEAIDAFCLPSDDEPFGLVVLEAMQAGLPVIASETAGPCDIVIPLETGELVPIGDVAGFAAAMARLAIDPQARSTFGIAGQARLAACYTQQVIGRKLASALGLASELNDERA